MSQKSLQPRPEQVAELTRGIQLPVVLLQDEHLMFIAEYLAKAWKDLSKSTDSTIRILDEPDINALMVARLNTILDEDPQWGMIVRKVSRGEEMISFDGSHLQNRPDLSISLTDRRRNFPFIIECKLIDAVSGKRVNQYCNDGLVRFVSGEYAWYAQEAMMLAYVRDGSSISSKLTPHLTKQQKKNPNLFATENLPKPIKSLSLDLAFSRHGRQFRYIDRNPYNDPGPIAVWHLWLSIA